MMPTQNCFCASTSLTDRCTCPIRRPSWFGSTSCADAGAARSRTRATRQSFFTASAPCALRPAVRTRPPRQNGGSILSPVPPFRQKLSAPDSEVPAASSLEGAASHHAPSPFSAQRLQRADAPPPRVQLAVTAAFENYGGDEHHQVAAAHVAPRCDVAEEQRHQRDRGAEHHRRRDHDPEVFPVENPEHGRGYGDRIAGGFE